MAVADIEKRFSVLSGLSLAEVSVNFDEIITEATAEIESKLRESVDKDAERVRLDTAIAALSFYKYALYNTQDCEMESFAAGDVSIKHSSRALLDRASRIWQEAHNSICDLLIDENFLFKRIAEC
ncbi:MAG: hypothetical protein IJ758_02025 [Clostridia bacterium]|nr:hypothetical protein [Clostridia bacterium]